MSAGSHLRPAGVANGEAARPHCAGETEAAAQASSGASPITLASAASSTTRAESPERSPSPSLRDREKIVRLTRAWLGTPYRHQASVRGVGADCLGLVRGVWRELIGPEPEAAPAYSADWAEVGGCETLLEAARRRLVEIPLERIGLGDVVLFRMRPGAPAKHCGIVSWGVESPPSTALPSLPPGGETMRFIHAYWGRAVVESWMSRWWRARLTAAFRWPVIG